MSSAAEAKNRHVPIEEMELYRLFDEVSDWCWDAVENWPTFTKRTMAEQLVTAADSVCANLVEGDGRWGVKDGINFFIMARASARETRMWLRKCIKRKRITLVAGEQQIDKLTKATRLLNLLINYRRERGSFTAVRESAASYDVDSFTEE